MATTVNVMKSLDRLRKVLSEFGTSQFSYREDFDNDEGNLIFVEFKYDRWPVSFKLNVDSVAMLFLEQNPWSTKRRCSETEYIERAVEQAKLDTMKMLVEHVATMIDAVRNGGASFEQLFLAYFKLKDGRTVGEHLLPALDTMLDTGEIPLLKGLGNVR